MKSILNFAFVVLLLIASIAMPVKTIAQQSRSISGVVTDATNNESVVGANVIVPGTSVGTLTDADGKFQLSVPAGKSTLEVSYLGYQTQTVSIGSKATLVIQLAVANQGLNEVVVVGYGTVKKRDLTGAVSSIKNEDITRRPGPNPMESLQGKVAGLDITRTSGEPGAGINMQLRGIRSFTASGNPLIVIDGMPGDYATLNANDIESIEVLKDASSTAVYGSNGSNGVIIITTKKGQAGKTSINFNAYVGYNGWATTPTMRTGDDYLKTKRDAYSYVWDPTTSQWTTTGALWQSPADDETIFGTDRYATFQQGNFVNWAKTFLQTNAATQNYSLSLSGGNDKTKGYLSFNYTDELGQYKGDGYKLFSTNMRIEHNPYKWLTVGASLQGAYVIRDKAQSKLENALVTDPLVKPYNDDGTLNTNLGNNVYNLLLNYQPGVYENQDNNLTDYITPYIEIKPIKGLSLLSRLSAWFNYSDNYLLNGIGSVAYTYSNAGIAQAQITQNRKWGYQWDNILTYNFKLNNVHDITLTGVSTYYYNQNLNTYMYQTNITSNNFKWYNMQGDVNTTASTTATPYSMSKTMGFVGRANYSYSGKYLFEASIRRDGSSVLYKTNRWDNFPAASAAWRISDEKFMESAKDWLNDLKLRIGWGITGSAKIDPYSSVNTLESLNMSLGGTTQPIYRNSQNITNSALGWEKSNNTNIGLDASLIKNRINISMDYYITKTNGVIWSVPLPAIYGTYSVATSSLYQTYLNLCQTKNNGFELTLNTRNIVTKNFEWTSNLTFSTNKEKILKLMDGISNNVTNGTSGYTLTIGQPINSFYNYKIDGIWQIGQEKDAAVFGVRPGDLKVNVPGMQRLAEGVYMKTAADGTQTYYYTDLAAAQQYNSSLTAATSTYTYSAKDYEVLGHNTPDWSLGFQNGFKYKDFDLNVYAYVRWGQMINYNMLGWYQPNGFATNASPSRTIPTYFNYWTPTNPSNDFPVMNYLASSSTMLGFNGLSYVDGSFFKLKNITLGYTLPKNLLSRFSIEKFRIYGTVTNLLVVANNPLLKQYDPEQNGSLEYPLTKQVVVGLNITF